MMIKLRLVIYDVSTEPQRERLLSVQDLLEEEPKLEDLEQFIFSVPKPKINTHNSLI
jgi:hypothetical protein